MTFQYRGLNNLELYRILIDEAWFKLSMNMIADIWNYKQRVYLYATLSKMVVPSFLSKITGAVLRLRGLIYHMRGFFSTKARKKYYHMRV